jgi:hypothetical protein
VVDHDCVERAFDRFQLQPKLFLTEMKIDGPLASCALSSVVDGFVVSTEAQ